MRLAAGAALTVLAAVGVALGTWVIVESYSPVPYADFWGQLPWIERAYGGELSISDLWVQANEHRIFVPRLQFLADYRLFGGTFVFLFSAIAISSLVLAAAFAAVAWLETHDGLLAWGTFCVAAIATMSPVGRENLWWSYQVQFVQVFLFSVLAILALVLAARSSERRGLWIAASALAAVAASYSMANGLLVWLPVLAVAAVLGLGRRATAVLAVVGGATYASYLWHVEFSTRGSLSDPLGLVAYAFVYLGSVLRDLESTFAAGALGGVGVALFTVLCVLSWRRRSSGSCAIPFAAGVALFVLLSALQTAGGRLDLGVSQALSSRYTIASSTFWLALLVGFLTPLRERFRGLAPLALVGGAAVVTLALAVTGLPSRTFLRTEVTGKETTVLAYLAGVDDPSGTLTGGPSGTIVSDAFRWMEAEGLGPWAPGGIADDMRFTPPQAQDTPACSGSVDFVDPVGGGVRLTGWIVTPAGSGPASRNLAVLDSGGEPQGRGRVGTYRPDVEDSGAAPTAWAGFVAYAGGERAPGPLVLVRVGTDRRGAVCRLESR